MTTISPINETLKSQVVDKTQYYVELASRLFTKRFAAIPVNFALTGRAAGMYHVNRGSRFIRYNPYIFAKYFDDNLKNTVPHEVAHYIADVVFGIKNIKPHGKEWRAIMASFGVEAKASCHYNLSGIPQRRHRRFQYHCRCRDYEITTRRHNMIVRGERLYRCPLCRQQLRFMQSL